MEPWVTASDTLITTRDRDSGREIFTEQLPATVTSLAVGTGSSIVAGLATGDTREIHQSARRRRQARIMARTGSPVTALAVLPDSSVVTGTAAGEVRRWPSDATQGPTTFHRRTGAITAIAVAGELLLIAGEDGRLAVYPTAPDAPDEILHEVNLGSAVRALVAEPKFAAARDDTGRLWLFDVYESRSRRSASWSTARRPDPPWSDRLTERRLLGRSLRRLLRGLHDAAPAGVLPIHRLSGLSRAFDNGMAFTCRPSVVPGRRCPAGRAALSSPRPSWGRH